MDSISRCEATEQYIVNNFIRQYGMDCLLTSAIAFIELDIIKGGSEKYLEILKNDLESTLNNYRSRYNG